MKTLVESRIGSRQVAGTALGLVAALALLGGCVVTPLPPWPVVAAPRAVVVAPAPAVVHPHHHHHRWGWDYR